MIRLAALMMLALSFAQPGYAMGLFGPDRPVSLTFSDASHHATPIMLDGLEINGAEMGAYPQLVSTSWENPRGGNRTLTSMPWDGEGDATVDIRTEWTEIATGRSFRAEMSVPWQDLEVETVVDATAYMILVYGRDGEFALYTKADPDPKTGQYNGREVARVCGQRTPARDQNYGLRVNEIPGLGRLFERREQWMAVPKAPTTCNEEGA